MLASIGPTASLATAQTRLLTVMQELGSGNSISSAADDPAGMAQSTSYSVQLSSDAQAINNVQNGISLLDTAGGTYDQITQNLQDMRALTVQAGDGSLNADDLQVIQGQMDQIKQSIDQTVSNTQFNGQNLLDGSFGNANLQTGPNVGDTRTLSLGNSSSASLGISGLNITTASGQANALSSLDNAIQKVNTQGAGIGSLQDSLSSIISNLNTNYDSLAAAKSQVSDTDYAQASSSLAQSSVQQQASMRALAMYNATQNNVLSLLPK
jgi:flagellin